MLRYCSKLGLGVWEISIAAGTGADVMACGSCAAGPAPYVLHQPPCYPKLYLYMQEPGPAPYVLHQPPCYPKLYLYTSVITYKT